ncbi:MAG: hypothetical protein ABEJ70_01655 [Halobacteriaceae archaeon]
MSDDDPGSAIPPEELDVADDEHVKAIDENRYVVSPSETFGGGSEDRADAVETGTADGDSSGTAGADPARSGLADAATRHGFDVVGKFDDRIERHHHRTDDVVVAFESLLLWVARQVDPDTPTAEVLGILLMEADVSVRYPAVSLQALLDEHDLGPEDSIGDLQRTLGEDVEFPPASMRTD